MVDEYFRTGDANGTAKGYNLQKLWCLIWIRYQQSQMHGFAHIPVINCAEINRT